MYALTQQDRQSIRDLSKTKYDAWVEPPVLASLTNLFKNEAVNFTTLSLAELESFVLSNLKQNEPLIKTISEPSLNRLRFGIHKCYYGTNVSDLASGGQGLIVPTFVEIMHVFAFWIRDNNYKELVNDSDRAFYHKYFWCFETYSKLIAEIQLSKSA